MSDELKPLDPVRNPHNHSETGIYIGPSPDPIYTDVVRRDSDEDIDEYIAGAWEPIRDEVTITIPREVRDKVAALTSSAWEEVWGIIIDACKAAKAAES